MDAHGKYAYQLAWKVMAYTAQHQSRIKEASGQVSTGRKCEKPVMAYSLSWHPDQNPDKDHMLDMALKSLKVLELQEHECMIVAHRDTPHKHVHIIVNRIHPISGLVASNSHSYRKLSSFALEYAREHELKYCPQREENARKREQGEPSKYQDNRIQQSWDSSDNGRSLIRALESFGLTLAHGNKRLVVLDSKGKAINPVRHIDGIRAKDFRAKLSDVDLSKIPSVEEAIERKKIQRKQKIVRTKQHIQEIKDSYQMGERKNSIKRLEDKIANTSWWKKLFGFTRKDREFLERQKEEYHEVKLKAEQKIKEFKVKRELLENSPPLRKELVRKERHRSTKREERTRSGISRSQNQRDGFSFELKR